MELPPQAGAAASQASTPSGDAEILAGEAAGNNIGRSGFGGEGSHIGPSGHIGPPPLEDGLALGVYLYLADCDHPGSFCA
jgi:hypothetical protein